MTFRPAKLSQYQPTTPQSKYDCVPATTAHLVNRATVDAVRPNHADIRKAAGVTANRGLTYSEAAKGAAKYGVTLLPRYALSRTQVVDLVKSGCATGISIDCSITVHTTRRTNSFTGGHTIYLNTYSWWPGGMRCECEKQATYAHGEFDVEDPGTSLAGYLLWSADLVFRAAESRGGGAINVLAAYDTEGRSWKITDKGRLRATPSTDGKDRGPLPVGSIVKGGRTENGGPYKRDDGTTGEGWVHIEWQGKWSWTNGPRVKAA